MLEVGQFYKKNGINYGILDLIKYNDREYAFMSLEEDDDIDYRFYEVIFSEETKNYYLSLVEDEDLKMHLFEIEEGNIKKVDINDLIINSGDNTSTD